MLLATQRPIPELSPTVEARLRLMGLRLEGESIWARANWNVVAVGERRVVAAISEIREHGSDATTYRWRIYATNKYGYRAKTLSGAVRGVMNAL